jgi:CMP-N-acetylneuraminic acid synthetase
MMDSVCIIPARGGSKRIPRKNIKYFISKHIIGWSIEKAKQSGLFDTVIDTSDNEQIYKIRLTLNRWRCEMKSYDELKAENGSNSAADGWS